MFKNIYKNAKTQYWKFCQSQHAHYIRKLSATSEINVFDKSQVMSKIYKRLWEDFTYIKAYWQSLQFVTKNIMDQLAEGHSEKKSNEIATQYDLD